MHSTRKVCGAGLTRLDHHPKRCAFLILDHHFREVRDHDDINVIVSEIAACNGYRFNSLIHRACADRLDFGAIVLAHDTRDCASYCRRPRACRHFDNINSF